MAYIEVEGHKEFQRAVRSIRNKELNRRLGQANKRVGQYVIEHLSPRPDPRAVGEGKGASVRPSASKRDVLLRVGGKHRAAGKHTPKQPWGVRRVIPPGRTAPARPYIQRTAEQNRREIGEMYLTGIVEAFSPAFAESRLP